jgi:diguanylate cyclase (GGDEF)-like protein
MRLFYSYSHRDEELRQQLERHLSILRRKELINEWHDRKIEPGGNWKDQIDSHLKDAEIVLLLISSDFLSSDYCYDIEMRQAMNQHHDGKSRVVPIILRPCDWSEAPFAACQALPSDGKPVTTWHNQDEAFLSVALGIRKLIEKDSAPPEPEPRFLPGVSARQVDLEQLVQSLAVLASRFDPISLVYCDVDGLLGINQKYGVAAGDDVVTAIAAILNEAAKGSPLYRVKGDQFLIALPHYDTDRAKSFAKKCQYAIKEYSWDTIAPNLFITSTFSVVTRRYSEEVFDWVARAIIGVQTAKTHGVDQIVAISQHLDQRFDLRSVRRLLS